jgi:preprotein translocase subunit SecG
LLTVLANHTAQRGSVFDSVPGSTAPANGSGPANGGKSEPARGGILDKLQAPRAPLVPQNQ